MTSSIRHQRVASGEVDLHCAVVGDPDAPLVVLLHGFPEFWYEWRALLPRLAERFLAVAPDQRGYGRSDKPDAVEAYRVEALAGDVLAVADHFGKERLSVVGHDWGGIVAWVLATGRPDRVERLVAINAPHPALFARERRENPEQRAASEYIDLLVSPMAESALASGDFARLFDGLETGEPWLDDDDREAYREAWSEPGALTGMVHWYRANLGGDAEGARSAGEAPPAGREGADDGSPAGRDEGPTADPVRVPTLVVWGERDRFLRPGCLDGLDGLVEDLEIVRIPDAGHWVVHERPERVGELVESFLGGDRRPAREAR